MRQFVLAEKAGQFPFVRRDIKRFKRWDRSDRSLFGDFGI